MLLLLLLLLLSFRLRQQTIHITALCTPQQRTHQRCLFRWRWRLCCIC
jgi:hypothetical protein